jgi:hypothetical protein
VFASAKQLPMSSANLLHFFEIFSAENHINKTNKPPLNCFAVTRADLSKDFGTLQLVCHTCVLAKSNGYY